MLNFYSNVRLLSLRIIIILSCDFDFFDLVVDSDIVSWNSIEQTFITNFVVEFESLF